ncbi:MAG: hypothetical protein GY816_09420 [Cytophagales bacterium]|nr:hypothetical protein [Cytophagales bacterium]
MKHLKHLLAALVFISLIIFTNCGGGGGGEENDEFAEQAEKLVTTWTLNANGAVNAGVQSEWDGLTLTFTGDGNGGSYSTNVSTLTALSSEAPTVWPASGTWEFGDSGTDIDFITRSDDVDVTIKEVTDSVLELSFNISSSGARVHAINGDWTFSFSN